MQTHGATEVNNPELAQTPRAFQQQIQQQQQQQQNVAAVPSAGPGGINGSKRADSGKTSPSTVPKSTMNAQNSQTSPTPLSADQLMLKYQILAFKLISRSLPVPPLLQQAMFNPNQIQGLFTQDIVGSMTGNIIEASNNHHTQKAFNCFNMGIKTLFIQLKLREEIINVRKSMTLPTSVHLRE
ncbi:hypothetical protein C1645_153152 [Glomus cerebriforme]|uniref:QLQ domain-containing protein n=1 Tax=Glomus cerebriforme TaxID=658196 RepID=A0A397TJU9_9GLOM|nr:hypothetical protein C1645_153152 [Glomus cerebriforme]